MKNWMYLQKLRDSVIRMFMTAKKFFQCFGFFRGAVCFINCILFLNRSVPLKSFKVRLQDNCIPFLNRSVSLKSLKV